MLAAFEDAALAHLTNSPQNWQIIHAEPAWWAIVDAHGYILETHPSRSRAQQARHSGPSAAAWYRRTAWYLGDDPDNRPLSGPEQVIIASILDHLATAEGAETHRVRFKTQHPADTRTFTAVHRDDGTWQLPGQFYSHRADDLDLVAAAG